MPDASITEDDVRSALIARTVNLTVQVIPEITVQRFSNIVTGAMAMPLEQAVSDFRLDQASLH